MLSEAEALRAYVNWSKPVRMGAATKPLQGWCREAHAEPRAALCPDKRCASCCVAKCEVK